VVCGRYEMHGMKGCDYVLKSMEIGGHFACFSGCVCLCVRMFGDSYLCKILIYVRCTRVCACE